jgi:hypothetical protein
MITYNDNYLKYSELFTKNHLQTPLLLAGKFRYLK